MLSGSQLHQQTEEAAVSSKNIQENQDCWVQTYKISQWVLIWWCMLGALLLFLSESIKKIKILSKQTDRTIFTHPFLYKWGVGGSGLEIPHCVGNGYPLPSSGLLRNPCWWWLQWRRKHTAAAVGCHSNKERSSERWKLGTRDPLPCKEGTAAQKEPEQVQTLVKETGKALVQWWVQKKKKKRALVQGKKTQEGLQYQREEEWEKNSKAKAPPPPLQQNVYSRPRWQQHPKKENSARHLLPPLPWSLMTPLQLHFAWSPITALTLELLSDPVSWLWGKAFQSWFFFFFSF